MKRLLIILVLALSWSGCDNEIDINAERKELTIIYGMLDPLLDTNYVRVQRGYLGDGAASDSYGISDSLYYDTADIDVLIREFRQGNSQPERELPMVYDNSKALAAGTFTTEGHYLYRVPAAMPIRSDREYEVVVTRADGSVASARTGVVGELDLETPPTPISIRFYDGRIIFDVRQNFNSSPPQATAKMTAYQPIITFHYEEFNFRTKQEEDKSVVIRLPLEETELTRDIQLSFSGSSLNQALADALEVNEDVLRFFRGLDIELIGASEELMTFIELSQPVSGVNQNRPEYEQVVNGAGILSSRTAIRLNDILLQQKLFDRLIVSNATCDLNFADVILGGRDTVWCDNGELQSFRSP